MAMLNNQMVYFPYWCVLRREWMGLGVAGCVFLTSDYGWLWIIPENSLRLAPGSFRESQIWGVQ